MKRISYLLFLIAGIIISSCSGGSDSDEVVITSITASADKEVIKPNGKDAVSLSAINQDGEDITDIVSFWANGRKLEGDMTVVELGTYNVQAYYRDLKSNTLVIESVLTVTSMRVETDKSSIKSNGFSRVVLSAFDQDNDEITKFVKFYADGEELAQNSFNSRVTGNFALTASYDGVDSETNEFTVEQSNSINRKILIEEFTGEWCGWCPAAGHNFDQLTEMSEAVLMVGVHNGDDYEYSNEGALRGKLGINGFPSALLNRLSTTGQPNAPNIDAFQFEPIMNDIESQLEEPTVAGIAIDTELSGSTLTITPKIKFYEQPSADVYYTIYVAENNLPGVEQQNYFSGLDGYEECIYYNQPAVLTNYTHNHVLRKNATDALGELIPSGSVVVNGVYEPGAIETDLSGYNVSNCEIIVFIHYSLDGAQEILNAQQVKPGESIDYLDGLSS